MLQETLDNILAHLERLDDRMDVFQEQLDAYGERLNWVGITPEAPTKGDWDDANDEYGNEEIEGLISSEVDYDALTRGL